MNVPEQRMSTVTLLTMPICDDEVTKKYSSVIRLQRDIAYELHFTKNSRCSSGECQLGPMTTSETHHALNMVIRLIQHCEFFTEIHNLDKQRPVATSSRLKDLHPFLDK
jgi:hypothetical protein